MSPTIPPRPGLLATVRNRRGMITSVEPFDGDTRGRVHLVTVEYTDADGPPEDTLVWERESAARLLEPTALPDIRNTDPMLGEEFDAVVRAARWSAMHPYLDPDGSGPLDRNPFAAPFYGAIQVEDFQLVPLLKALRMPRVSLLLADDVGLGKTIEAGLILTELLLRRRVRRVLIACPASLRLQWKQEMQDKFSLTFDVVDRAATHKLQKRLGFDANPWRTFPRVITSYDYLKQPDVLEQFRSASRPAADSPHLPWDLLIVDEAHNLAPATFGEDSDLCRMLAMLAPRFEHRLFLTATPHNGHTRSFTGLLEILDPVRFTRKSEALTSAERSRVEQVVVRRLKREINEASKQDPPPFARRELEAQALSFEPEERALSAAVDEFRSRVKSLIAERSKSERLAGSFAVEILNKRLLSCPVAFADSWHRYLEGTRAEDDASAAEVSAARRAATEDTADDLEAESRTAHAARTVGAWLKPLLPDLTGEAAAIDAALTSLGLQDPGVPAAERKPTADARYDSLCDLIERMLRSDGEFRDDERLVVFTEYKTSLDYLQGRLHERYPEEHRIRVLYGGMGDLEREEIKRAFNDPRDPVRILIATDAAAEGLNLQETARFLLHWDVPWNPSRLEQRNGRLDRHGQARDVTVYHFSTDDDADLSFLSYVVGKVHTIREDLGSTGEVFDRALERRLIEGDDAQVVRADLDASVERARGRATIPTRVDDVDPREQEAKLRALAAEVDLDPDTLASVLGVALGMGGPALPLEGPDGTGRFRLTQIPVGWADLIDDTLRLQGGSHAGALPALLFDAACLISTDSDRPVFRPQPDARLLHLGHPLFHRALHRLARARFPGSAGGEAQATRWTARRGEVPYGVDALLLLTVEELAVNELRETFHHWVRTLRIPVHNGELGAILEHVPARDLRLGADEVSANGREEAATFWELLEASVKRKVKAMEAALTASINKTLESDLLGARQEEQERFQARQGELSALIQQSTIERLEREIQGLHTEAEQGLLFDHDRRLEEIERSIEEKEEEIRRRRTHYEELQQQLTRERERVLQHILPKRFQLRGQAQVFPVAVEIRLPSKGGDA